MLIKLKPCWMLQAMSHYQGEINLKMREESLTCKNFSFENSPLLLKTDFSLASHNVENGALILPDILVSIAMYSQSQYYDLPIFNTQIDLNQSLIVSTMKIKSTLAREKADLHVKMQYTNPYSIDASIQTDYESVEFNNVRVNVDDLDVNGTYNITLLQIPKKGLFQHGVAKLKGEIPGMSIVSSIVEAPVNIVSKKEIAKSKILQVHADSYIEDGEFYCYDCAVKTQKNRIAIKGAIDLNSTKFHYFEVGLLRNNGCAFFVQDIKGSVKKPEVELAKASLSLVTGTVKSVGNVLKDGVNFGTSLISKTGDMIGDGIDASTSYIPVVNKATGAVSGTITTITDATDDANHMMTTECQPFYRGVVSHPLH